jgi:PAS domain S-box-containing protein
MRRNGPTYEELERRCRRAEALLETLRSEKESKNDDGTRELRGNERIYRSLCESMTEGLALHELLRDPSGRPVDYLLLDVNPAFERILGLRRDDVVGRGAREVYGVSEAPFLDLYARVATTGEPLSFEAGYEPMGRVFSVSVFSPGVNRFATMFHDVTDRARAEETLRRSEFLQRALVETIPDLVWLKDPEGVFLSCNPAFERFFGASEAEIVGRTDADFVAPELAEFFREHDRKALEAGGPSINEEWLVFADGGYRGLSRPSRRPCAMSPGGWWACWESPGTSPPAGGPRRR